MPLRTVGNTRILHTTNRVRIDSSLGPCESCLKKLEIGLKELLGPSMWVHEQIEFDAKPLSHVVLTIKRRLSTKKRGQVMDLVNDKINRCPGSHEDEVKDEF